MKPELDTYKLKSEIKIVLYYAELVNLMLRIISGQNVGEYCYGVVAVSEKV